MTALEMRLPWLWTSRTSRLRRSSASRSSRSLPGSSFMSGLNSPKGKTRASRASAGPQIYRYCLGKAAGLADSAFKSVRRLGVLEVLESLLCRCNQRTERIRFVDCDIGQDLAVDLDASLGKTVDETAIGQALLADSSVDALDPESAERALAVLAVAVSILLRTVNCSLGGADGVLATATETSSLIQNLLVLCVGGNAAFYACHVMISFSD